VLAAEGADLQTFLRRWCRVLLPLPAAVLEIMAGAMPESKRKMPEPCPEGRAAGRKQESVAGARGSGVQEPERGLTTRLSRTDKRRDERQTINEAENLRTPKPRRLSVSA